MTDSFDELEGGMYNMKRKLLKTTVVSLVLLLVFGTGVYAGSNLEQISAYLNRGVTLTWNGVPFYPQEADGSRVFPITYNGRTYIPAKFIAEKAGLGVGWDGTTSTVSFTTPDYVPPVVTRGTYTKVGNGTIKVITDDLLSLLEKGFNVEETMAVDEYGTHTIRITKVTGTSSEKKQMYIDFIATMDTMLQNNQFKLSSTQNLGNGHYKYVYVHQVEPVEITNYSTNTEIVLSGRKIKSNVGTYTKIGNGTIAFLTDDLSVLTTAGYNVEETLATSDSGVHKIKITKVVGTSSEKEQAYITYITNMVKNIVQNQWKINSTVALGGGHYKYVSLHESLPLEMTMYSTATEIIFSTKRIDMNQTTVVQKPQEYFEGYFSSVPKPSMDSSWIEEVANELKDWSFGSYRAYTLSKRFYASESKVDAKFEEYKKTLVNNGFGLYEVQSDHYTYTKGDIAVEIFNANDNISVNLSSGYQAPHVNF